MKVTVSGLPAVRRFCWLYQSVKEELRIYVLLKCDAQHRNRTKISVGTGVIAIPCCLLYEGATPVGHDTFERCIQFLLSRDEREVQPLQLGDISFLWYCILPFRLSAI